VRWLALTVTLAVHRLARDGWLEVALDRSLTLTAAGEGVASTIVRRHRILERWLVDVLGLDWAAADREAALMAHGVSETVVPRLDEQLAHPRSCPHGNPIPGRGEVPDGLVRLDQLALGVPAVVVRISEVAEHEVPQLLNLLQLAIMPGRSVALRTRGSTMGVDVDGRQLQVDCAAARTVWVVVGDLA
jgi:DtxR family Mn-dependent transcriptional regulator